MNSNASAGRSGGSPLIELVVAPAVGGPPGRTAAPPFTSDRRVADPGVLTRRGGFTMVEVGVGMTILAILSCVALSLVAQPSTAPQISLEQMSAVRNGRYALTVLGQDLEALGTNVPESQPALVYADADVLLFSADYATNASGDPHALFYDPDAPASRVRAPTTPFFIPTTGEMAADSVYRDEGEVSPAEMIAFFFVADSLTAREDDFVLMRQVNDAAPEVVVRHLLRDGATPFFLYEREIDSASAPGPVPDALLPIHHSEPIHLAPRDSGASALADGIRTVRVTLVASNGLVGDGERSIRVERRIVLPHAARRRSASLQAVSSEARR